MKIIVVAGGQGTKLWPYSRNDKPKQFQPIIGDTSSYQQTIEMLLAKFAPEDIYISTKHKFIKYVSEQSPQIPLKNYIVEPDTAKDTGPGHGLAFLRLSVKHPNEPFFLIQADCMREPTEAFLKMIEDAGKIVTREKKLLTGGIKATEPNIGVDYLQLGDHIKNDGKQELYEIANFLGRRKTYKETKELVEGFSVVTHSNHYCWYPELMMDAYKQYRPDWYEALQKMRDAFDKPGEDAAIKEIYETMEKGSTEEVTKHVMEARESAVILLPFKWTDIGTWGSVYEFSATGSENYIDGNIVTVDVSGSLIKSNCKNKLIAVAGLEDIIIVDTDDALLVIPKNKIEKIKDIQAEIAARQGDKNFL
jgi:mannose-1-phosphate guanylyltransferase